MQAELGCFQPTNIYSSYGQMIIAALTREKFLPQFSLAQDNGSDKVTSRQRTQPIIICKSVRSEIMTFFSEFRRIRGSVFVDGWAERIIGRVTSKTVSKILDVGGR